MNFLIVEGYKDGALAFEREAGIKGNHCYSYLAELDEELIDARIEVRKLIERGEVGEAIKRLNDINVEILDSNPDLYFELRRQQVVELFKQGKIEDAIVFAQNNLSGLCSRGGTQDPRAQKYQTEIERTMALLMYADLSAAKPPISELVDQAAR